jgi:hypothetical protein
MAIKLLVYLGYYGCLGYVNYIDGLELSPYKSRNNLHTRCGKPTVLPASLRDNFKAFIVTCLMNVLR